MNEELIERLRTTEQMLNVAHFKEAESIIREACDAIEELQSKLTASRRLKKGKWIRTGEGAYELYECSSCGKPWLEWYASVGDSDWMSKKLKYCPNCGADMREEKNNAEAEIH